MTQWPRGSVYKEKVKVVFMTRFKDSTAMDKLSKVYNNIICHVLYDSVGDGGTGMVVALRPSFKRLNDAFQRAGSQRHLRRPSSLLAPPPDVVPQCDQNGVAKCNIAEGPTGWATSFEKLLEDPLGLHAFADFLKKEYSAENIYFWTACERYRKLTPGNERTAEAQRIYQQHLSHGAPEPVNVDAQGRQHTEQCLQHPDSTMFSLAQKQIFNLMKFDSYPRFLKSDLYKQCLSGEIVKPLDAGLMLHTPTSTPSKLKKSLSNAEDRRRKSLLPWHRKIRSKSKDRGEVEFVQKRNDIMSNSMTIGDQIRKNSGSDTHSSHSSLTSLDLATTGQELAKSKSANEEDFSANSRSALCRVFLSNGSTSVVQINESETIQQLVNRLLAKRGLRYSSFEVFIGKHPKPTDISEPSAKLAGCEVTVEQRVVFKLDLPNRKTISVKSKYTKIIIDVLRPILYKYQYNLDQVVVTDGGEPINLHLPVTSIDGEASQYSTYGRGERQDLASCKHTKSDKGSVKSEDWGSEHSSGMFGKFLRRDSGVHERKKKFLASRAKGNPNGSMEDIQCDQNQNKKPLIAKLKAGANKLHVTCSESDELVEGLTRAQRCRLEDQRGTKINFELPDFLKKQRK
ncbi:hypothetical protein NQ317_001450 [Molorchus minor]|uniref:Regulator of G-protein signaling loco n=1 Tax=Molorchus minor TaxID=1323400 RepID=A0ABQ9JMQ0_9CUCU|nr:hypothetical protein NQ317_001450 [Molorchus minor]